VQRAGKAEVRRLMARDNLTSALGKILTTQSAHLPDKMPIVYWLQCLPLLTDKK
jgi:hypothetical protein